MTASRTGPTSASSPKLTADEDPENLEAFMKEKGYTFPVIRNPPYIKQVLPTFMLGQQWIVDRTGTVRLQRTLNEVGGHKQAFIDESSTG
jgi:hypothetical protein